MTVIEQSSYGEFSQGVHGRIAGKRIPASGTIEITRRCNLTCAHCYNNLPMTDPSARAEELSVEEHIRLLDEISEMGCLWLLFTGGEIFARKDFLEIYTYAKRKGFLVTLFTNATIITPRIADYLAELPPFAVEVTLYGSTRETYEALTGVRGSYDRCLNGIRLLLDRGIKVKLKTVAVSLNRHEVWEMKRLAEELGVGFKFDAMINPRIDDSLSPLAVRLTPREIVELDLRDPKRVGEWNNFADHFLGAPQPPERADEVYHCGAAVTSFAIDPLGRMTLCVLSHKDTYDLRQGSFGDAWDGFMHQVRRRKITRLTKCTECHLKAVCGMCPAMGELETGDPEEPIDFLCQVAHLRAEMMGWDVPPHGDCEYCKGGERRHLVDEDAAELAQLPDLIGRREPESRRLPVLRSCGSDCGC